MRDTMPTHAIARAHPGGWFDTMEVQASGLVRVSAWTSEDPRKLLDARLRVDGDEIAPTGWFRTYRPDVARLLGIGEALCGVAIEFFIPTRKYQVGEIVLLYDGSDIATIDSPVEVAQPAYSELFSEGRVKHRDDIYGYGPPTTVVAEEVLAIAKELPGPVLDFGCGAGALVRALREGGVDAHGLELDRPDIADSIADDVRPHITLYAGTFPTPFPDKAFASVVLVEVLEHIADYEAALREIARLTRDHLLVTVPDISAIPQCHPHRVVPWHLLESTHLNFFTQQSLTNALAAHFRTVEIAKICSDEVGGTRFFTNLMARCQL